MNPTVDELRTGGELLLYAPADNGKGFNLYRWGEKLWRVTHGVWRPEPATDDDRRELAKGA